MMRAHFEQAILLPDGWPETVKSALLHVMSLAHWAIVYSRSSAVNSPIERVRLASRLERAENEIALLKEEIRIKNARMAKSPAKNRPFYPPLERMAILELRAARAWSLAQTARTFLLDPETISSWIRRIDEQGERALVRVAEPLNKFPDFVRHVVSRLKVLCPTMGKKRIAHVLARAGLQLSATTVGRMLAASTPKTPPVEDTGKSAREAAGRVVTARYPNHVWHVDLTVVPISSGRWIPWFPFSLPQVWPFVWHVAVVIDHFSRAVMGLAIFRKEPTSLEIRCFLGRVIRKAGRAPKHLVSDKGSQFDCAAFRKWCKRRKIKPRYGAVGRYGSIAVIERFIRSLKDEWIRRILIPFDRQQMRRHLSTYARWYNHFRPHQSLAGRTPQDVCDQSSTSDPCFEVRGPNGVKLLLFVSHLEGQRDLPIVELRKAA